MTASSSHILERWVLCDLRLSLISAALWVSLGRIPGMGSWGLLICGTQGWYRRGGCSLGRDQDGGSTKQLGSPELCLAFPRDTGQQGRVERDGLGGDRALQQECPLPWAAPWQLGMWERQRSPAQGGRRDLEHTGRVTDGL